MTKSIGMETWMSRRRLSEARRILRLCPEESVREEGLACLYDARPDYLYNAIPSNHPNRTAALLWILRNSA